MVDPYLVALLNAVEDGAECPPLWMTLLSGDRVSGTPRPARDFVQGTFNGLVQRGWLKPSAEVKRAKRDEKDALIEAQANRLIRPFNVEIDVSGREAITLADATVLFGGRDDGTSLPVVRVQLSAVALWWLAGGKEIKGGNAFFVGVAI